MKKKIEFVIEQTGAIELTENLGGDPSFRFPIKISSNDDQLNKKGSEIEEIYYHSSVGWVPIIEGNETSLCDLNLDDELTNRISLAFNELGNRALGALFHLAERLWPILHDERGHSATITDEDIDELYKVY